MKNGLKIFLHMTLNFKTMFRTKYPHSSLHSNFFALGNNTSYVSQYSFALQDCWDQYVLVLLCTRGIASQNKWDA